MDEDDVILVPDTPSPLTKRSIPVLHKQRHAAILEDNLPHIDDDSERSPSKFHSGSSPFLPLPGQSDFALRRAEALKSKKQKEKLKSSPFKRPKVNIASTCTFNNSYGDSKMKSAGELSDSNMNRPVNGFVKSSTLISPTKLSIHMKKSTPEAVDNSSTLISPMKISIRMKNSAPKAVDNSSSSANEENGTSKRKIDKTIFLSKETMRRKKPKQSYGWPSSSSESDSDNEILSLLKHKTVTKKRKAPPAFIASDCAVPKSHSLPHSSSDSLMCERTSTITSCSDPLVSVLPLNLDTCTPTKSATGPNHRVSISPIFSARPAVRARRLEKKSKESSGAIGRRKRVSTRASSTASSVPQDHPLGRVDDHATIDLTGSVSVTPKTKAALDQIRQHESDEAMAKRLQEEMDREYAIALQDTTSSHEPVPNETFDPMFALSPPSELQTGGHEWHMYSPVRPRSRNSRQRGGTHREPVTRLLQSSATNELLELIGNFERTVQHQRRGHGRQRRHGLGNIFLASPNGQGNDYEDLMRLAETLGEVKDKGLTKGECCRLPVVSYRRTDSQVEECNICMAEYEEGDPQKILPCFHSFHSVCIDQWICKNATCPICRVEVKVTS
ncbi:uncharacterized protein LOC128229798 [Mya arenaria]|uniref:uncharacterized protein LOC128229798 n=1 Tax=Mya arenaria TaxID=6604 RepID=UPI0022E021E3|nr:uncharacterized protein LOC128229798 [Mya arenaria]